MWRERLAQGWYSGSAWTPVDQFQKAVFSSDGVQVATAMRDEGELDAGVLQTSIASQAGVSSSEALEPEASFGQYRPVFKFVQGFQSPNIVQRVQTSTQDVPAPETVSHGQASRDSSYSVSMTSNMVPSPLHQQRPTIYGLSQGLAHQYGRGQSSSAPAYVVTQQASESAVSDGSSSTSSSYSGSQSQGSTGHWLSQWLASRYGSFPTQQGTTRLNSASALSMIQQATEHAPTGNGSSSLLGSYVANARSSTGYGQFQGLSSPYGFPTQQGTSQLSSAPALTLNQQATEGVLRRSGFHTGSQSFPADWLSQRPLSHFVGSQAQQGVNQLDSVPRLTQTQQISESMASNGGSQSQGSTCYRLSQWIISCYGNFETWQSINKHGSVPGLTLEQQTLVSAASNGLTSSTSGFYSGSQSQDSMGYGLFPGLSSPRGFQTQRGTQQLSFAPALTMNQ